MGPATQRLSIRSSSRASPVLDLLKQFWLGGGGFGTSEEQYCTLKESHVNTSLEFPIDVRFHNRIQKAHQFYHRLPFSYQHLSPPTIRPLNTHNMTNLNSANVFMAFGNFLAPRIDPYILLEGNEITLNLLQRCLLSGAQVQRFQQVLKVSPFTAIATALNAVCPALQIAVISEELLCLLTMEPWFSILVELYRQQNQLNFPLSIEKILSGHICSLDIHSNFLLVKAVQIVYNLQDLDLGIVQANNNIPKAFIFGQTSLPENPTVWLLAEGAPGTHVFHGIGFAPEQQVEVSESESEQEGDGEEGDQGRSSLVASSTPRKTATRITALQTPLAASLSAEEILTNHPRSLHYINLLKVCLHHDNNEVFKVLAKLPMLHKTKAGKQMEMKEASGVVKRLKVAIEWLEKQFAITKGALRATYDQARVTNGRKVRPNKELEEAGDDAQGALIGAIMAWISQGGPMPAGLTAITHEPAGPVAAPTAMDAPPVLRNTTPTNPIAPARHALAPRPSPQPFSINYDADAAAEADALAIFTRPTYLYNNDDYNQQ
ncbi:hypothetical protein D6D28_09259 [Aureobasidium pullulans]|uniref:Uncharacterized protein n=1 Tax=Aureobasidium pullulans TaxID=5580 RepID=A0A4S8S546_AURPU|nr:hypothetical protein D6D28_09259 [Aureobasidium pullulans]